MMVVEFTKRIGAIEEQIVALQDKIIDDPREMEDQQVQLRIKRAILCELRSLFAFYGEWILNHDKQAAPAAKGESDVIS